MEQITKLIQTILLSLLFTTLFLYIPTGIGETTTIVVEDQSQNESDYGVAVPDNSSLWQEFKVGNSHINTINLHIEKFGSPGDLIIAITEDPDLNMTSPIWSTRLDGSTIESNKLIITVDEPFETNNRTWTLELRVERWEVAREDPNANFTWYGSIDSNYNNGSSGGHNFGKTFDFAFSIYTEFDEIITDTSIPEIEEIYVPNMIPVNASTTFNWQIYDNDILGYSILLEGETSAVIEYGDFSNVSEVMYLDVKETVYFNETGFYNLTLITWDGSGNERSSVKLIESCANGKFISKVQISQASVEVGEVVTLEWEVLGLENHNYSIVIDNETVYQSIISQGIAMYEVSFQEEGRHEFGLVIEWEGQYTIFDNGVIDVVSSINDELNQTASPTEVDSLAPELELPLNGFSVFFGLMFATVVITKRKY